VPGFHASMTMPGMGLYKIHKFMITLIWKRRILTNFKELLKRTYAKPGAGGSRR
jgi:hypothetical protein